MPDITLYDYLLLPFYLAIIYRIAFFLRKKYYPEGHALRKYFIPGLTVKIAGGLLISFIYAYYYKGGDTFIYFEHVKLVNGSLENGPGSWWRVLNNAERPEDMLERTIAGLKYYVTTDTYTVWQLSAVISLFCFNLFLPLVVVLAFASYSGVWLIFRYFSKQYPLIIKWLAISCLYIPTVFVWGSGLFKDTYCQMAIGWLLWGVYSVFSQRKISLKYVLLIVLGSIILIKIKVYIFLAFFPFLLLSEIGKKIQAFKFAGRVILTLMVILIAYSLAGPVKTIIEKEVYKYSLETIAETTKQSKEYFIRLAEDDGSSIFDIGEIEPTIEGILSKFIPATNASLFRPYLWESRKPIVLLAALESTACILLTIWTLFRIVTKRKSFHALFDWNIVFFLSYSLIFAFFIGVSTSNFGSLSRYKIPFLPFYTSALIIISSQSRPLLSRENKVRPASQNS